MEMPYGSAQQEVGYLFVLHKWEKNYAIFMILFEFL